MEERGNFVIWAGGLVVVALAATGLSVLLEFNSDQAKRSRELGRVISDQSGELEELRTGLDLAQSRWSAVSARKDLGGPCEKLKEEIAGMKEEIPGLRVKKDSLTKDVRELDFTFTGYRGAYRSQVRQKAVGEALGTLRTNDGKEYEDAVITAVRTEGLEIRHASGVARISPDRLGGSWQQRFQWEQAGTFSGVK